jgi:hypothetical protein
MKLHQLDSRLLHSGVLRKNKTRTDRRKKKGEEERKRE